METIEWMRANGRGEAIPGTEKLLGAAELTRPGQIRVTAKFEMDGWVPEYDVNVDKGTWSRRGSRGSGHIRVLRNCIEDGLVVIEGLWMEDGEIYVFVIKVSELDVDEV